MPHSWPRASDQEPINIGDPAYDPLYPLGDAERLEPGVVASTQDGAHRISIDMPAEERLYYRLCRP